ncbi:hypothetical protein DRE_06008 [Drechslerella stenobrocha 248]|uniref:Exocyst complex component Sec3 PIP2-binding N-terminal domain-containing protein n=1 Tax=Drechslerella stenobrocha 248 TaxID=1043628 RepID=W7HMQ6_9PEZI|nr:hypothetical protein DRE_06008 [Drechslerella stenobrocha 248]
MASPYSSISSAAGAPHSNLASSASSAHAPSIASTSTASHRETYENERTRIQQSCFSRADADGQLLECYITHVRVIEDGVHPSAPPPPDYQAAPDARKNRVIIVAVRKSGRVRLHKARENNTGSFSIGKSWYLDDLTQIENDPGCTGFTATIGKPYYWQTRNLKEKDAFVQSLFRIFKKYTGGKTPALVGFDNITSLVGEGRPGTANSDTFQGDQLNGQTQPPATTSSLPPSQTEHTRQLSSVSTHSSQPSIQSNTDTESVGRPELQSRAPDNPVKPRVQRSLTNESTRQLVSSAAHEPKSNEQVVPESLSPVPPSEPSGSVGMPHDQSSQRKPPFQGGLPTSPGSRDGNASRHRQRQVLPIQTNIETQGPTSQTQAHSPQAPQAPLTPIAATPTQSRGQAVGNKSSVNNLRNRFWLVADAYAAGGALAKAGKAPPASGPAATNPATPATTANITAETPLERPAIRELKNASNDRLMVRVSISKEDLLRGKGGVPGTPQESSPEKSLRRSESPAMQNVSDQRTGPKALPEDTTSVEHPTQATEPLSIPSIDISGTTEPITTRQVSTPSSGLATPSSRDGRSETPIVAEPETTKVTPEKDTSKTSLISARHKRRRSTAANSARSKYLSQIDVTNLTVDIDNVLEDFGWDGREMKIDALEHEVRQELAKVESGNIWIATDEENKVANSTRIDELARQLDETLAQCDELDGLLTLYAVELMSLQDDIAYIENQSQGLQVQTANQKTLLKELEVLLQTVSISPEEIETLQNSKVQADRLPDIESSLSIIYKAIITIDPTATASAGIKPPSTEGDIDDDLGEIGMGKMMALKDKKEKYVEDSKMFGRRLIEYMKIKYRQDLMTLIKAEVVNPTGKSHSKTVSTATRPKAASHTAVYQSLYKFAGLMLFIHDVDKSSYLTLIREYTVALKEKFNEEIRNHIWGWRGIMRKPTAEDQEILFTHNEKEPEGAAARGLGVMRSATRAKSFKSVTSSDSSSKATGEKIQDGRLTGSECFTGFIDEIIPVVAAEQNFLSEFFHISSQILTFLEYVQSGHPDDRRPTDLNRRRAPELDKHVAKRLFDTMTDIFGFLNTEIQSFVGVITTNDPLQGVGVIYAVEKKLGQFREGTNQEFLVKLLLKLNEQMKGSFINFLKDQVRAIEATKVKFKKRRAVLDFIKSFPLFSAKIEDQLPPEQLSDENLEVRDMVNNGYSIINRAMFDAMQAIAKQTPSSAGNAQSVDPEDKEALNYHIMIIQNTVYYTDSLDVRSNSVLQDFKQKAEEEYKEHMALYVSAVIRKYLEKTLDFVEGVEALEQTSTPEEILGKKSYNKLKFKEVLSDHQKEISGSHVRDGIKQLVKRVTKHFGDEGHLDHLSVRVLKETEMEYLRLVNRMNSLLQGTYRDQGLEMPLKREDVTAAFAKQMSVK